MIGLKLAVVTTAGELGQFTVTPKVQVEFERHFKIGVGKAFQQEQRVEHMYWLAWKSVHAAGLNPKPFDSWLDEVVDVQMVEDRPVPLDETA